MKGVDGVESSGGEKKNSNTQLQALLQDGLKLFSKHTKSITNSIHQFYIQLLAHPLKILLCLFLKGYMTQRKLTESRKCVFWKAVIERRHVLNEQYT